MCVHVYTHNSSIYALEFHADAPPPPTRAPCVPFKNPFVYLDEGPVRYFRNRFQHVVHAAAAAVTM